jgi:hypothetical protein
VFVKALRPVVLGIDEQGEDTQLGPSRAQHRIA